MHTPILDSEGSSRDFGDRSSLLGDDWVGYNQKKTGKPETPSTLSSPRRRRFLVLTAILGGGAVATSLIPNPVRDYVIDLAKKISIEEVTAGKDSDGVYADFRGERFKVVREPINLSLGETLDGKLYALNSRFNPDLRIKGGKLETLQVLFHTLNSTPNALGNLALGETKKFQYKLGMSVDVKHGDYHFPVYSSRQ